MIRRAFITLGSLHYRHLPSDVYQQLRCLLELHTRPAPIIEPPSQSTEQPNKLICITSYDEDTSLAKQVAKQQQPSSRHDRPLPHNYTSKSSTGNQSYYNLSSSEWVIGPQHSAEDVLM
jgi:hypothetical protein